VERSETFCPTFERLLYMRAAPIVLCMQSPRVSTIRSVCECNVYMSNTRLYRRLVRLNGAKYACFLTARYHHSLRGYFSMAACAEDVTYEVYGLCIVAIE
jgi:hypothetical protein